MVASKKPVEIWATNYYMRTIPTKKFPLGSKVRESKANMLGERFFRSILNVIYFIVLYKIMSQDDCEFLDVWIGGNHNKPKYFDNYPC